MGATTKIEWASHTFSPWIGCTKISAGCTNCYAEHSTPTRVSRSRGLELWGPKASRLMIGEAKWRGLLAWNRAAEREGVRRRVFPSLCDPFEEFHGLIVASNGNPAWWCYGSLSTSPMPSTGLEPGCRMATLDDLRERMFDTIKQTPWLDWLLLTKRPQNMIRMAPTEWANGWPSNVWAIASVEDQKSADARVPELLKVPARIRGLSVEPLLGPIQFPLPCRGSVFWSGIHWQILGGESGPDARPCEVAWVRDLVRQCKDAGVPCFVKQLGSKPVVPHPEEPEMRLVQKTLRLKDPKGGDWSEWPEDLRVREFPKEVTA